MFTIMCYYHRHGVILTSWGAKLVKINAVLIANVVMLCKLYKIFERLKICTSLCPNLL